jgi:hypothetical protein
MFYLLLVAAVAATILVLWYLRSNEPEVNYSTGSSGTVDLSENTQDRSEDTE